MRHVFTSAGDPALSPVLLLNRTTGAPGTVITIEGKGFRPNSALRLQWRTDPGNPQGRVILVTVVVTDAAGSFAPTPALIFKNDSPGVRSVDAEGGPDDIVSAPFLVVPGTTRPAGNEVLQSRGTLLLQRG